MRLNLQAILAWSEDDAREFLARWRWIDGIICPKCGHDECWIINRTEKNGHQHKVYKCKKCRRQFSVTVGTIFEDSHIPLNKWIAAIFLLISSKKGISAHQLHRMLWTAEHPGAYKSAWFMVHRIREAMNDKEPGILSGVVEADETYIGPRTRRGHPAAQAPKAERRAAGQLRGGPKDKEVVFGIIERGGKVRTKHISNASRPVVAPIMREHIDMDNARLMTDESPIYKRIGEELPHEIIRHNSEYVRGEVHTNNIEGYWAILKRGLYGVYQHVDAGYLGRYLDEFEYRFNTRALSDAERFCALLMQVRGRVTWYCQTPQPENPYA